MATIVETISDLQVLIELDRPAWVWGVPGIGKSESVYQVAAALGYRVVEIRLSMFDPVDLRGLPAIVDGLTKWIRPQLFAIPAGEKVMIFFDEMDRAAPAVQNAAMQIVLNKRVGEFELPESVRIVAAGNGATDRRGTNVISAALANRLTHLYVEPDAEAAAQHFTRKALPVLAAFLRYRPNLVWQAAGQNVKGESEHANPSPRAWEALAKFLPLPDGQRARLAAGTVGSGPAMEFEAFYRTWRELPALDALLSDPMNAHVPSQPGALYAVASALARKATVGNFANVAAYLSRLPIEFGIMAIRDACQRDKALVETSTYSAWQIANQAVTL